ncbi:fused MFS/spermidine synthase [Legionella yabuuchiae]|uniref:fused MFS/spermidine synthase n=1 Tax=Legionella yabuuchiae TaxID=376727 RepID=UPI001054B9E7|nr:fused MFS/spermidine synthase [Legionella yabuuchiae]
MIHLLLVILLLEGFITISVEVLTIRQLLPFYGGSVLITSIIIGVFLLFLALGYWRGGSYKQDFFKQLSRNFTLSMIWIGLGLSYTFVALFYYVGAILLTLPFLVSLFGYLLLALAPIVYWLGQTVPLTTNLFSQNQRVSHISGRALFLSTVGSFLGALLTSLLLFQYLGVAWTVVINCLLLFMLVIYLRPFSGRSLLHILLLFVVMLFILVLNVNAERLQFKVTNNYGNYQVVETADFSRVLQINQSSSSLLTQEMNAFPYIEFIRDVLFQQLNIKQQDILVIGAGGFTLTAAGTHDNRVTYVDIDPAIKTIAEEHFLKQPIKGKFIGQDARQFLQQNASRYDVILSDVYSHQATIPPSLLTREYFQSLSNHLKQNGLLLVNIIANPLFMDAYSRKVYNTIHSVFPYCTIVPLSFQSTTSNVIYLCPKLSPVGKDIYTDDLNTATMDYFKSHIH